MKLYTWKVQYAHTRDNGLGSGVSASDTVIVVAALNAGAVAETERLICKRKIHNAEICEVSRLCVVDGVWGAG